MTELTSKSDSMTEVSLVNPLFGSRRLGDCEVCGESAKYRCPACEVKTCSLPCVSIHKKELSCTGVRNKVKFKHVHHFTDMDLQSDYRLLEEMGRSVERIVRARKPFQKNQAFKWQKLKSHLESRGTYLYFLPPKFSKHVRNTSYLDWKSGVVFWKVECIFPQATQPNYSIVESRFDESCQLSDLVEKYLGSGDEKLKPYMDEGGSKEVKVLMKAEKTVGSAKYLLLSGALSLAENLQGKIIIEHPTLHVVLNSSLHHYHIVSSDSVKLMTGFDKKRRRPYASDYRRIANGSMTFFSDNIDNSDSESG